jgi:hypothetical protein
VTSSGRGGLAEVPAGAGLHQPQLRLLRAIGTRRECLGDQAQRDLGTTQRPLAVGQDVPVAVVAGHAPVGAQLAGGLGVVAGVVRGDPHSLPHGRQP